MARLILLAFAFLPLAAAAAEADAAVVMARMQLTINHGVSIAVDGANLVLQAKHGQTQEAVDKAAEQLGRELIGQGKALVVEAASGATMMKLHARELSESESAQMISIHRLEGAALAYLKALESL